MTQDIEDLRARAAKCTTHHHACDCRELAFAETRAQLEALDYELTASPRGMTALEALLSEREVWLSTVRKVSEARQDEGKVVFGEAINKEWLDAAEGGATDD